MAVFFSKDLDGVWINTGKGSDVHAYAQELGKVIVMGINKDVNKQKFTPLAVVFEEEKVSLQIDQDGECKHLPVNTEKFVELYKEFLNKVKDSCFC